MKSAGGPQNLEEEMTVIPQPPLCCLPRGDQAPGVCKQCSFCQISSSLGCGDKNSFKTHCFLSSDFEKVESGVLTLESWKRSENKQ